MRENSSSSFHSGNFSAICDKLCAEDRVLADIRVRYGDPPMWHRPPGFETLLRLILEQQVSLSSAQAAYLKLLDHCGEIRPETLLKVPQDAWRPCYVSRQKARYITALSEAVLSGTLNLEALEHLPDAEIKTELEKLPGIGNWTSDVYVLMALNRRDIFPIGDVALRTAMKETIDDVAGFTHENLLAYADRWSPDRSVACYFFWHNYLSLRNRKPHY
ncbi:MAG: DNA-3-methyladenine glycosylase 2 family protein [Mucilaginibacter polytrichastri]|nr:DNA-3-methyladenine glycosylase 2 family protein [Mucilaginibacter polytrichastri]